MEFSVNVFKKIKNVENVKKLDRNKKTLKTFYIYVLNIPPHLNCIATLPCEI